MITAFISSVSDAAHKSSAEDNADRIAEATVVASILDEPRATSAVFIASTVSPVLSRLALFSSGVAAIIPRRVFKLSSTDASASRHAARKPARAGR